HPELAARMETLLANPPYLFVQGRKIPLPDARVVLLLPQEWKGATNLWRCTVEKLPLLPASAPLHTLPFKMHSGVERLVERLMECIDQLPLPTIRNYPASPPWQEQNVWPLLRKQVKREQQQDHSPTEEPYHWRRALHTLIVKNYRGNSSVYGYLKTRIKALFPDEFIYCAMDQHALQQWLHAHPGVTRDQLREQFWELARHCPI
ncbi:hypothetical protein, partial [Sansalvadorimonas verongulae]|uniref:hypothetical protein n=1 Tax=Sansalvadorimonas verongulae TaxID=2172824 RepID=UPI0018AD291A